MKTDRKMFAHGVADDARSRARARRASLPLLLLALCVAATTAGCQAHDASTAGVAQANDNRQPAQPAPTQAATTNAAGDELITAEQVGRVRLGMTVREVKALFPEASLQSTPLPDVPSVVAVKQDGANLLYFSTDRMDAADAGRDAPRDEDRLTMIATDNPRHRTAQGVGPGTTLDEAVKAYGPALLLYSPDAEYAKFSREPAGAMGFWVAPPSGQKTAGVYRMTPAELKDGFYESVSFHPGSKITHVSVSGARASQPEAAARDTDAPVAEPFRKLLAEVKGATRVPVLLPGELPRTLAAQTIHTSGEGKPDGYEFGLASRPDCGANSCFVGLFEAHRGEQPSFEREVRLAGGITGRYQPTSCGGSCSPPTVEWVKDGVLYSIQLNVQWRTTLTPEEEERMMVEVANSAINAGPR